MRRPTVTRRIALAAAVAGSAVATGVALAGGLPVSAARLTVFEATGQVPLQTCTLTTSSADAWVDGTLLADGSNHGTETAMQVRSSALGDRRAFVRFDVSSCSIPAGGDVKSATLQLHLQTAPGASRSHDVHRVTAPWTETGVTWSNQPAVVAAATASVPTGTTSGVALGWNVRPDVQAVIAGTANNGWRVDDGAEGALTAQAGAYGTRENATASRRPQLVITYRP
jgi:large repetitive protein